MLRITAGSAVNPGGAIVDILDDIEREVVIQAPSEKILLFRCGEKVSIRFAGKEEREGRIEKIAPQAQKRNDEVGSESFIEVRIRQVGEIWPEVPATKLCPQNSIPSPPAGASWPTRFTAAT